MPSRAEFAQAVTVAEALLSRVGLRDFQFTVDPRDGPWLLKLQTALAGAWYEIEVPIERPVLREASDENLVALRDALLRVGLPLTVQ